VGRNCVTSPLMVRFLALAFTHVANFSIHLWKTRCRHWERKDASGQFSPNSHVPLLVAASYVPKPVFQTGPPAHRQGGPALLCRLGYGISRAASQEKQYQQDRDRNSQSPKQYPTNFSFFGISHSNPPLLSDASKQFNYLECSFLFQEGLLTCFRTRAGELSSL
jgi:hypothetical protein